MPISLALFMFSRVYRKSPMATHEHFKHRQGGRTWQPFVGGKSGHENFRQAGIHNFRDKCIVFARNRKFANLTQSNMQYISHNSALLAQETLF